MAEQWDQATGDTRGPGGPGLNRNALQATLADLVRDADGPGAGAPAAAPATPAAGGRPVVPGAPVPTPSTGVRPLRGPAAGRPVVDFDEIESDAPGASAPVPGGEVPRPSASGRPRPFGPEHVPPAPNGNGPAGAVRPGSGVSGGFNSSVGGSGFGGSVGAGPAIGAGSLSGRITPGGDLGDNLARLTPTPTEQPTVPLRRRREEAPKNDADKPAQPPVAAAPAPQPRPVVAVEAWSPHYDDILPQRPTRSGRAFRRAR